MSTAWQEVSILDLVSIASGQVDPRLPAYRRLPLIAPDHIESGTGRLLEIHTAAEQGAISGKYVVKPGDVIYSKIRPYLRKAHMAKFPALCSADMYPLRPKDGVSGEFVLNTLLSERFTSFAVSVSMRSGIPKLNRKELSDFRLTVPCKNEQRMIGAALAATDDLVEAQMWVLAKKQAIKRGMIQALLTGRARLPGFDQPWTKVCLGDHVTYLKTVALSRAQLDDDSPLRCLHYGDIHTTELVTLDAANINMPRAPSSLAANASRLRVGDLVFVDTSEDAAGVGRSIEIVSIPAGGLVSGLHTIAARVDPAAFADGFKAYLQFHPVFRASLLRLAAGTKVLATTRSHISSISIILPGVDEQKAIAKTLQDVEADIRQLNARLAKARNIKQGMMQELLSGRTRLPVEVAS